MSGKLLFHVFGALAQYERALTKERVIADLASAKLRGHWKATCKTRQRPNCLEA